METQAKPSSIAALEGLDEATKDKLDAYMAGTLRDHFGADASIVHRVIEQARLSAETGNLEEAIKVYANAVIFEPMNLTYLGGFANCALLLGQAEPALRVASLMVAIDPENPVGYVLSGAACRLMGRFKEASEDFQDARRLAGKAQNPALAGIAEEMLAGLPC